MHYLVIGAGAAGLSAAENIRKYDTNGAITVFSKEPFEPYSLCALPTFLAEEMPEKNMVRYSRRWWKDNKITLELNTEVVRILPRSREATLSNGRVVKFDRLLIATGSKPIIPKIPGNDLFGIFTLNSLKDGKALHGLLCGMGDCRFGRAVVIGGGFIGLEAAVALKQRGMDVTVIEMLAGLLPKMVDRDINLRIQNVLKEKGIKVKTGTKVLAVLGKQRVEKVKTSKGVLGADIVVWCVGVQPNIEFLKNSGIKTNGGVIVNKQMRTNYDFIYAAGDIVNSYDLLSGEMLIHANWPNALEQGRIAGANMAGHYLEYEGAFNMNVLNVFDTPVVSIGLHTEDHRRLFGKSYRTYTRNYGIGRIKNLNRVIFAGGKFTGFQSVGWPANIGWLTSLIQAGQEIPDSKEIREVLLDDNLKLNPKTLVR